MSNLQPVVEKINFAEEEDKILSYWNEINAFQEAQKLSKGKPSYSFYDGPPFATGLPHYGHILAGTIKDVVTRYAYQNGFHVERRFGWDCHGLPVEYEIDKRNGFKGPEDIEKIGVAKYNNACRGIVMKYSQQWETLVNRIGRWIDFENDYKTMYPSFMESVWWVFSELWNKGLVYRGVKVMPFSTACCTPLSNFESGQNYKDVIDPAIVVKFRSAKDPGLYYLAWTTTPWTLPSNLALCVNPEFKYVKLKEVSTSFIYVLMESRLDTFFKKESDHIYSVKDEKYEIAGNCIGKDLLGEKYIPLFPYFQHLTNCFQILNDNYVTSESGTGIVHQAPYFGEDDLRVCLDAGLVTKDQEPICPVDARGHFTLPVTHFNEMYVKDADKHIIKHLKNEDKVFSVGVVNHNYPYCWRSDTPLIYRAVPSWFIRVEQMSEDLLAANDQTYWVPDFVKEKRFGNWLREARDWAVSRNRYWGTPIPIWVSEDFKEIVCVGSIKQLEELAGSKVTDLHKENIDHLTIPSRIPGNPPLKRVSEVFDCWFESGSMPYAQVHYPFENAAQFHQQFPADFIAEGIDQTRGWFYTLLVISTALFNKAPFKNLIVNGLVLAADGQKMSKSKQNYPDPMQIINKFGADALRLYLINSPVVRGDKLRFREAGVLDILKDVLLPWYNAYRFFIQNIEQYYLEGSKLNFDDEKITPINLMDKWILSSLQSLIVFVRKEMAAYRLYTVVPRLVHFIEDLTNWYVRLNRKRLKGNTDKDDCKLALSCLGSILSGMIRLMAPYTPFLTELMFKNLKVLTGRKEKSVHYLPIPQPRSELIDEDIEQSVLLMQTVIDLGRVIRDRKTLPVKCPLKECVVILKNEIELNKLKKLEHYIIEELNIKTLILSLDKEQYGLKLKADPDHKILGPRLKSKAKGVTEAIKNLTESEILDLQREGKINVLGETVTVDEISVSLKFQPTDSQQQMYETNFTNNVLVLLDINVDDSMMSEGMAREVINRVQKLRKKAGLVPSDDVTVYISAYPKNTQLDKVINEYSNFIENTLKAKVVIGEVGQNESVIIGDVQKLKGADKETSLRMSIIKEGGTYGSGKTIDEPYCRYVNVCLWGVQPGFGSNSQIGTILLENPVGYNVLHYKDLVEEIHRLFGIRGEIKLLKCDGSLFTANVLDSVKQECILVVPADSDFQVSNWMGYDTPLRFVNVVHENIKATVLLENPLGNTFNLTEDQIRQVAANVCKKSNLPISTNIIKFDVLS